jgi:hypothetical protein
MIAFMLLYNYMYRSALETQYLTHSSNPGYGTAHEGLQVCDFDEGKFIDPATRGLAINRASIERFVAEQGGNAEHFKYATIALYGADSPQKKKDGQPDYTRRGFVSNDLTLTEDDGSIRFPNIGLLYEDGITEESINHAFRHELGHLLTRDSEPLYNRHKLTTAIRMGMFSLTGAVLSALPETLNGEYLRHLYAEGYSLSTISATVIGVGMTAVASTAASVTIHRNLSKILYKVDRGERTAEAFADKHADFMPIKFIETDQ